jgi:hypothetical protein
MRAHEFLIEADANPIGRKYQHIEDLVFTNGSYGGLHAVERLRKMGEQGANIELKWDGMPVIYWGRDADGTFNMMPKNAWEYAKRGKMELDQGIKVKATSAKDVYNFVANTGRPNLEAPQRRQQFAKQIADLWPFLEKASPKQGYLEGGILFWPSGPAKLNKATGEWDFKPNVTEFHVAANSELGKRIAKATVMIAATGFYPSWGSGEEGRLENVESLSTPEVIIQGTTYVQEPPKLDTKALDKVESYIQQNAAKIDAFLSAKPGLKSPGSVIYSFLNKNLRGPGLITAFKNYAQENLSKGQFEKVMADIDGLTAILTAVEQLTAVKEQLIAQLSTQSHGGIRQTRPEGYVQAPPAGEFKRPLPGQFVKTISQQNWTPNRNLYDENN